MNVELQIKKSINTRFPVAKFSTPFWKENNNLHTVLFFFFSCPYFKCIYYASKIQNKTYIMKGIVESAPSVNDLQQLSISKLKVKKNVLLYFYISRKFLKKKILNMKELQKNQR